MVRIDESAIDDLVALVRIPTELPEQLPAFQAALRERFPRLFEALEVESVGATLLALFIPSAAGQIGAIAAGALIGWLWFHPAVGKPYSPLVVHISRFLAVASLCVFIALLFGLPLIVAATGSWIPVAVIIMFFSACALFAAVWMKEVAGRDLTDPNPAM